MALSTRIRIGMANWRHQTGSGRIPRSRIVATLLLACVISCNQEWPRLLIADDDVAFDSSSIAGVLAQVAVMLVLSLALAAMVVAAVPHLARLRNSGLHRYLVTNPQHGRYGIQSLLVTAIVLAYWYVPVRVDNDILMLAYESSDMVLAQDLAIIGGCCLAAWLGLVALLRPARVQRVLGLVSLAVSVDYLCAYLTWTHLWETAGNEAVQFAELTIGIPASLAYDLAGANPAVATVIFLAPLVVVWLVVRRPILRHFAHMSLGWPLTRA